MNAVVAGIGWGLAGGFLSTSIVLYVALYALWKRTKQPELPPAETGTGNVFDAFGSKRA